MTDNHITRAKAAAERAANSNKTAERESLALLAIADALIALGELTSIVKARDLEVMSDERN